MSVDTKVRKLLGDLRKKVEAGDREGIYGDKPRALKDIDSLLNSPSVEGVKHLLLPTANLQELSMANDWGTEFLTLATELESLLGIE